jgi:hypothetical protein
MVAHSKPSKLKPRNQSGFPALFDGLPFQAELRRVGSRGINVMEQTLEIVACQWAFCAHATQSSVAEICKEEILVEKWPKTGLAVYSPSRHQSGPLTSTVQHQQNFSPQYLLYY